MRILHAADLHLDAPLTGLPEEATVRLRREMRTLPGKIVDICRKYRCDLLLLSGDVFDGQSTRKTVLALHQALKDVAIPVFIAPGNHDFCTPDSPWMTENWPDNVYIFKRPVVESVTVPGLNCRIYGAGFTSMDCPGLLEGFAAEGEERCHIGVFHGDAVQKNSPYNPVTQSQVAASALDYLALGHIHKSGSFTAGETLCAWPGCPMGHGYDETGEKGVLLVEIADGATAAFLPLDVPRFYDLEAPVRTTAEAAVAAALPGGGRDDFYRITLTGESEEIDLSVLSRQFAHYPNLQLRDKTRPVADLWAAVGEDSLEGECFRRLRSAMEGQDEEGRRIALLAARICRTILDGGEVELP